MRKTSSFLIVLGILCLLGALGLTIYNIRESDSADRAAREVVSQMEKQLSDLSGETPADTVPENREMPSMEIDGRLYIGYISVPSIDLNLPVMEDWDYAKLRIAPCRYSGSYYTNDLVIAGHNYRSHFSPLRSLPLGTEVLFTNAEGTVYTYCISDILTLNPEQTEDMTEASEDWDLTLFTCTISGSSRCTIRCVRTDRLNNIP